MNRKAAIMALIMIVNAAFFAQIVAAADPIVPVEVDVSVDFTGERSFKLAFPNGGTRIYSWDPGQLHSDETFTQTIYWSLDESEYCTESANQLAEYKNITASLTEMLEICGEAVVSSNETKTLNQQINDLILEKSEYESLWQIEEDKRKTYQNSSQACSSTISEYKRDYERCQTSLNNIQSASAELKTCKEDLEDCEGGKSNNLFLGAILGLVGGYLMWGRKKKGGPSEQAEAGSYSDQPNYGRYPGAPMDGPRR